MLNRLNGWRRIAITLSILWIAISVTKICIDYFNMSPGFFVYLAGEWEDSPKIANTDINISDLPSPPKDTAIINKVVPQNDLPIELPPPPKPYINWQRFILAGLFIPFTLWFIIEVTVIIINWIIRGFQTR